MLFDLVYYYGTLSHKENVLRNLVSYSRKINATVFTLNDFAKCKYSIDDIPELKQAIFALYDDRCINIKSSNEIEMLPKAYNYLQNERLKNKDRLMDSAWDLAKLILAALAGALLAKYIH